MEINILEADSIQKSFDYKLLLSDVYFKCQTGEVIGLLGRNGSGKSTLLKIIFGIIEAEYRFVRINGVKKDKTSDLIRDISYLGQDDFIPPRLQVKETIAMAIPKSECVAFLNDEFIAAIADKKINQLSGGELRYLEIKLILCNRSKFALLDEPYNGLSPIMIQKVNEMILAEKSRKGIIMTDHNYSNIITIADRILLLIEGKTHPIADLNELVEKGYLHSLENV